MAFSPYAPENLPTNVPTSIPTSLPAPTNGNGWGNQPIPQGLPGAGQTPIGAGHGLLNHYGQVLQKWAPGAVKGGVDGMMKLAMTLAPFAAGAGLLASVWPGGDDSSPEAGTATMPDTHP